MIIYGANVRPGVTLRRGHVTVHKGGKILYDNEIVGHWARVKHNHAWGFQFTVWGEKCWKEYFHDIPFAVESKRLLNERREHGH